MKRIVYDVPKWHLWLHREARGLDAARPQDPAPVQLEDELFDRLYAGDPEPIGAVGPGPSDPTRDPSIRAWAERVHKACEELPSFKRLAGECRGNAAAASTAVESLVRDLGAVAEEPRRAEVPQHEQQLRRRLLTGCARASAAVDELRESTSGLEEVFFGQIPGTGSGKGAELPPSSVRALVNRLRHDARLRRIALLAGRFKRIAAAKRRQKVKHGADELTDIGQGGELARLLPSELAKLARPALRRALLRDLLERQALQYQLSGTDTLGRGPLVLLLDKSGSMDGDRDLWATAVALALLAHAHDQHRPFALVAFDSYVKYEAVARAGDPLPEQALFVGCGGGTDIALALGRGLEIIRTSPGLIRKADVVLVTDGGSDAGVAPALRDAARELGVTILGLGIGVSPEWLEPWCDDVEVINDLATIDDAAAAKLFAAA